MDEPPLHVLHSSGSLALSRVMAIFWNWWIHRVLPSLRALQLRLMVLQKVYEGAMISHAPRYQEYSAMHGDVEILRPFNEILITSGNGKIKAFSDKEMIQAGRYVQTCEMPVTIEQAEYQAGTGMEYRYTSNKRANAWRIMPPKGASFTLKALPRDMLEKHIAFDSMFRAGISQTLAGAVVGISRNCAHHWAHEHTKGVKALQAATDGVGGAA